MTPDERLIADAWMEAVYGGRLRFLSNVSRLDYLGRVYGRWATLYAQDRWRSIGWAARSRFAISYQFGPYRRGVLR